MEEPQPTIKKSKGKHSAKKSEKIPDKNPWAYTIKDKLFGEFKARKTANGWWGEPQKVHDLITAYKIDATDQEACIYAGILPKDLEYFQKLHPDFLGIKRLCKDLPCLTARKKINEDLGKDWDKAWKYMAHKKRDEFGPNIDLTSKGEKLVPPPNKMIIVDFNEEEEIDATEHQ